MTFINYFLLWHVYKHKRDKWMRRWIDMNDHDIIREEKKKGDDYKQLVIFKNRI